MGISVAMSVAVLAVAVAQQTKVNLKAPLSKEDVEKCVRALFQGGVYNYETVEVKVLTPALDLPPKSKDANDQVATKGYYVHVTAVNSPKDTRKGVWFVIASRKQFAPEEADIGKPTAKWWTTSGPDVSERLGTEWYKKNPFPKETND